MNGKIIVVTHKEYKMPCDTVYLPVCVGVGRDALRNKYQADDEGENISDKNILYCELTALYWAWKNLNCDYIGLAHYRRYLTESKRSKNIEDALSQPRIEELLMDYDIIVPKEKRYSQTIADHYINCIKSRKDAHKIHLQLLRDSILEVAPEYIAEYDKTMNGHSAHMLNMFVMKKQDLDNYCEWLFKVLFVLEKKIYDHDVYYDRIMGAFSEFLLDVWIRTNKKTYIEVELIETERDYWGKIKWALKRKFFE